RPGASMTMFDSFLTFSHPERLDRIVDVDHVENLLLLERRVRAEIVLEGFPVPAEPRVEAELVCVLKVRAEARLHRMGDQSNAELRRVVDRHFPSSSDLRRVVHGLFPICAAPRKDLIFPLERYPNGLNRPGDSRIA